MNKSNKKILRQYALEYGSFIGTAWFLLFFNYVKSIEHNSFVYAIGILLMIVVCILFPLLLAVRINKKTTAVGQKMNYGQAFSFSLFMFFFASVLHSAATYVYLEYVDQGQLFISINNMLAMPEIKSTYESLGLANEYAQALDGLKDIEEAGNANIALNFLGYDCFLGFFGSIFTSYFASATIKLKAPQPQTR